MACDNAGCLVLDEVQCGLVRMGHLWSLEAYSVYPIPNITSVTKPPVGSLPIEGVLVTKRVAFTINFGDHRCTLADDPLICHARISVLTKYPIRDFLAGIGEKDQFFKD